jgi:hypothetical protein
MNSPCFLTALVLGGEDAFAATIVGKFALLNFAWTVGLIAFAEGVRFVGIAGFVAGQPRRTA